LNIELVECMSEPSKALSMVRMVPSKGPLYGKNGSPFAMFFMFRRKDIMCLNQFP
jgi:hypothetical protein